MWNLTPYNFTTHTEPEDITDDTIFFLILLASLTWKIHFSTIFWGRNFINVKISHHNAHPYVLYMLHTYTKLLLFQKAEIFEFVTPCYMEHVSDKKTSRQQVLGLRNSNDTEVLLQFDDKEIAEEWIKDLKTQVSSGILVFHLFILCYF